MIRYRFDFMKPDTIDEAVRLLGDATGQGRVLGGGSVLVPALTSGDEAPSLILDLAKLGLAEISQSDTEVTIGALTTYASLRASEVVQTRLPLLAAMVDEVTGGPGLWNLATLGGSACHGNPASDGPGCLVALDAKFRLVSTRGSRLVSATDFFVGPFMTDRDAGEILTAIIVPAPSSRCRPAYLKLKNAASSWPIVTASCLAVGELATSRIRLCLGGAAPIPLLLERPYPAAPNDNWVSALAEAVVAAIETEWADELAGPGYRRAVAGTMAARAIRAVIGDSK